MPRYNNWEKQGYNKWCRRNKKGQIVLYLRLIAEATTRYPKANDYVHKVFVISNNDRKLLGTYKTQGAAVKRAISFTKKCKWKVDK